MSMNIFLRDNEQVHTELLATALTRPKISHARHHHQHSVLKVKLQLYSSKRPTLKQHRTPMLSKSQPAAPFTASLYSLGGDADFHSTALLCTKAETVDEAWDATVNIVVVSQGHQKHCELRWRVDVQWEHCDHGLWPNTWISSYTIWTECVSRQWPTARAIMDIMWCSQTRNNFYCCRIRKFAIFYSCHKQHHREFVPVWSRTSRPDKENILE